MQDHQLTFDWILYAILVPPVAVALWELLRTRDETRRSRKVLEAAYDRAEAELRRDRV